MKGWTLVIHMAAVATAVVQMEVRYSDTLVNIGNSDLNAITVDVINAAPGNERSILTDESSESVTNTCLQFDQPVDTTVQVQMNGAWGQTPGLEVDQMRTSLISTMMEALNSIIDQNPVDIFTDCSGLDPFSLARFNENAACAPETFELPLPTCEEPCKNEPAPGSAGCGIKTKGLIVPASLKVNAFIDDELQPDEITITFSASSTDQDGGCGLSGTIAEVLAGFIPGPGALFAAGIGIACGA